MKTIPLIVCILVLTSSLQAQESVDTRKKVVDIGYYENGQLEYKSVTIRRGLDKKTGRIYGKQIVKLKEYYKNGQLELRERKVIPRIVEKQHLDDNRHILAQKKEKRRYKRWDEDGELIEKGKYNFRGRKRVVKYNHNGYKKWIITFNPQVGRDEIKKKGRIYK